MGRNDIPLEQVLILRLRIVLHHIRHTYY